MAQLAIHPAALYDAGKTTARLVGELDAAASASLGGLGGTLGMAGADETGRDFATSYDDAAAAVFAGLDRAAATLAGLAEAQFLCAAVYSAVEAANAGVEPVPRSVPAVGRPGPRPSPPPRAAGAPVIGEAVLHQWVLDMCGVVWPGASPVLLRAAADVWEQAGGRLRSLASSHPPGAIRQLSGCASADTRLIADALRLGAEDIHTLAAVCQALGESCAEFAGHVDAAHQEVRNEVLQVAVESAAVSGVSALAAPLTVGVSVGVGAVVSAARLTFVAARLGAIVQRLARLGAAASGRLRPLAAQCRSLGRPATRSVRAVVGGTATRVRHAPAARQLDAAARGVGRLSDTRTAKALAFTRDLASGGLPATVAGQLAGRVGVGTAALAGRGMATGRQSASARAAWARLATSPEVRFAARRGSLMAPAAARAATALVGVKGAADGAAAAVDALIPGRRYADGVKDRRAAVNDRMATKLDAARGAAEATGATPRLGGPGGAPAAGKRRISDAGRR